VEMEMRVPEMRVAVRTCAFTDLAKTSKRNPPAESYQGEAR